MLPTATAVKWEFARHGSRAWIFGLGSRGYDLALDYAIVRLKGR